MKRFPFIVPSVSLLAGSLLLASCSFQGDSPSARVEVVVDTLHGEAIPDPYRWMENRMDPEVRAYIAAQNAHTEEVIGQTPLRAQLEGRLRELMDTPDVDMPQRAGDYEYFSVRRVGQELPVIVRRPASEDESGEEESEGPRRRPDPQGDYEVVLDPHGVSPENTTRFSIVGFSPDDRYMVYNERDGGADEVVIRIRDLETGEDLADALPRGLYGSIFFDNASEGLYYEHRSREDGPRFRYHALGTELANDPVLFGQGYGPESRLNVSEIADGRFFLVGVSHGWSSSEVHLLDREAVDPRLAPGRPLRSGEARPDGADAVGGAERAALYAATPPPVITLVEGVPARFYTRYHDGTIYLRTDMDAFHNRVLAVDVQNLIPGAGLGPEAFREVIPESPTEVLQDFTVLHDRIFATYLDSDVNHRIRIFNLDGTPAGAPGTPAGEVEVPEFHSPSFRSGGPGKLLLTLSSYTTPPTTWLHDLETGEREVWEEPEVEWDGSAYVTEQVWRTSADGTRAPMWVVRHRDAELNGDNPTMLSGYGGFYVSRTPGFSTMAAAWLELGGIYAVATLRGGAEFGEEWHRDGMLERKQHVFDDFISAAEYLIDNNYTRPERLGIQGGSNGGLLVAAAMTQRPELFGAVLCGFPDVDILRFPWYVTNNNAPALLEYGDSRIPSQFEAIRQYSPYQNVEEGVEYPAILFTTGDLDTRVPPEGALKMTARLQAASASDEPTLLRYHEKAGHSAGRGLSFSRRVVDTALELTFLAQELGVQQGS